MKKALTVILSVILIALSLCSCSGPNAELTEENVAATVDAAMTALTEFDTKSLDKYVDSQTLDFILKYANEKEQFRRLGEAIFENLTYEIKEINLESKTVTVSVKNKNLYLPALLFVQDLLDNHSTLELLGNLKNDQWLDENLTKLTDEIAAADMQETALDITLTIKQEKKNLVLSFDDDAENRVSGGALSAIKSLISGN